MKAQETLRRFRVKFAAMPGGDRQALIVARALVYELADCVDFAQLADGKRLRDGIDFSAWLRELEAVISLVLNPPAPATAICHRCSHSHRSGEECGVDMGGGGRCDCRAEVVA